MRRLCSYSSIALALLLAGCAPDLAQLASDPNAICIKATSIYFTVDVNRNHGCEQIAQPPLVCPVPKP